MKRPFHPPVIRPLDWPKSISANYDAFVGCVGYESRSRYLISQDGFSAEANYALIFSDQQVLQFDRNEKVFKQKDFRLFPVSAGLNDVPCAIDKIIESIFAQTSNSKHGAIRLVIDVSSMTRQMIGVLAFSLAIKAAAAGRPLFVDFLYSAAKFGTLPKLSGPIVSNGPVFGRLAGWSMKPNLGCGMILGIGYEPDLALGVIEELEASAVWTYRPQNNEKQYDKAIDDHNVGLFDVVSPKHRAKYSITDPYSLFASLNQLVLATKSEYRIIIVPFGPKIFSLASVLVALVNYPEIGVWRVSGGVNLDPVDRIPNGVVSGLSVEFSGRDTNDIPE